MASGEGGGGGGGDSFGFGDSSSGGGGGKGSGVGETGLAGKGDSGGSSAPSFADGGGAGSTPALGYAPSDGGVGGTGGATDGGLGDWFSSLGGSGDSGGGLNLSGPGDVGGAPSIFDTGATPIENTGTPFAGGGADAFAAPAGVSGTPELGAGGGGVSDPWATTGVADGSFDYLNPDAGGGAGAGTGAPAAPATDISSLGTGGVPLPAPRPAEAGTGSAALPSTTPATTAAAPAATPAASGGSGGGGDSGWSLKDFIGKPGLGAVVGGAGLLNNLINGNGSSANKDALNSLATNNLSLSAGQTDAGKALQQYIATGTLPAGYEAQVQQGVQSAKQRIISNYASRGMPTDPSRNSVLAQELNQVDAQVPAMREQLAKTLSDAGAAMVQQGLSASGVSSGIYQSLAKLEQDQNNARGSAIANFAAALNGSTGKKAA